MHKIRILLVDDHTLIRECLASILEKFDDLEVVGHLNSGTDAVKRAAELAPDIVVMDISMQGISGIEATRRIVQELPSVKVLMLSIHSEPRYVVESINAGAMGFMVKSCLTTELIEAVRTVAENRLYVSPQLKGVVGDEIQRRSAALVTMTTLTQREREILVMLAEGKGYAEIADLLQLSTKTVETHRANIMKKLNVNNMAGLTKYAIREGLLLLD